MTKQYWHRSFLVQVFIVLLFFFLPLFTFVAILSANARANPTESAVFTKYSIAIAGVPVGNARVTTRFNGNKFDITATGRTSGVSRLVSDGKGTLSASGEMSNGAVLPSDFKMDTVDDQLITRVRMSMIKGAITDLLAAPPLAIRPDRIPVQGEHLANIVDPLSAFIIPLDADGRIQPEKACNRTIPVFDGWQRFDVNLAYKEERTVRLGARDGFSGPVVVCAARYVPVAGHRPTRKTTVYLQNNKNMELWLAPVAGLPALMPVYIKIGTALGPLTLAATIFTLSPAATETAKAQ